MSIDAEYHEMRRAMSNPRPHRVSIIRQHETNRNAIGPRIWNWFGVATTRGEAEAMAREAFERETGFYIEDHPGDEEADGYIVSAVCREDELEDEEKALPHRVEIEITCPHCGTHHLFRVAPNAGPYDDSCEDCEGRFTVDPSDETAHLLPSM